MNRRDYKYLAVVLPVSIIGTYYKHYVLLLQVIITVPPGTILNSKKIDLD